MPFSNCVVCKRLVRRRQEAFQCDVCDHWQHRTCGTGITRAFYNKINKQPELMAFWSCKNCQVPVASCSNRVNSTGTKAPDAESTRLSLEAGTSLAVGLSTSTSIPFPDAESTRLSLEAGTPMEIGPSTSTSLSLQQPSPTMTQPLLER